MIVLHTGVGAACHVLESVLALVVASRLLLWDLVHVDSHVLLPILARGAAVLPLVVEAEAPSLVAACARRRSRRVTALGSLAGRDRAGSSTSRAS